MRLLIRFAGFLTLVAPIAIFTLWSVSYVYACFEQFLSPGKPLDISLPTKAGDLRVKAESYNISLWQGALIVQDAEVYEPNGELLASAETITARFGSTREGFAGPIDVHLRGVTARVKRGSDRTFSALKYLPEQTDEKSTAPFLVEVVDGSLIVIDDADGGLLTGQYTIPQGKIEGIGDEWLGSLELNRKGHQGRLLATLDQKPDRGFRAKVFLQDAEASDLLPKLSKVEELRDQEWTKQLSAQVLTLSGNVELEFPKDQEWSIQSDIVSESRNIRYGRDWMANQASFKGELRRFGLSGVIEGVVGHQAVNFDGQADWRDGVKVIGKTSLRVASVASLPPPIRKLLPPDASFQDASFEGWMAIDEQKGTSLSGDIKAASLSWKGETVKSVRAHAGYADRKAVVEIKTAVVAGGVAQGVLSFEEKDRAIKGEIDVRELDLKQLGKKYAGRTVTGKGELLADVSGTLDKPQVELRAHGRGAVAIRPGKLSPNLNFEFGGQYTVEGLDIKRLKVYGGETAAMLSGRWDAEDGEVTIDGSVRRFELGDWIDNAAGMANAEITVSGKLDNPKLTGYAEVYAAKIQDYSLPFASTEFSLDKERASASDLLLTRGGSKVRGHIAYSFADEKIEGKLSGESIQIAEWVPSEVSGLIDFRDAVVSGTAAEPKVQANIQGESLLVRGVLLDKGEAQVSITPKFVDILAMSVQGDAGTASGKGFYNFETKSGQAELDCDKVVLSQVLPELPEKTVIDGTLRRVRARAEMTNGALKVAQVRGTVNALSINRTPLGQGNWSVHVEGDDYTASARIGQIDAYIEAEELKYNAKSKATAGAIYLKGFEARDLYLLARPYMAVQSGQTEPPKFEAPAALIEQLDRFQGTLNAGFILSGTTDNLNIECPDLTVEKMELGGADAGEIAAVFIRKNQIWGIQKFDWKGGPGNVSLKGDVAEHGEMDLDGEIKNFKPAWLHAVLPELPLIPGEATISFIATGPTKSPLIHATLDGEILSERASSQAIVAEGQPESATKATRAGLGLVLDSIDIRQGEITAEGRLNYGGLQGKVDAKVPFEYPFTIPESAPIRASLNFNKRELAQLKELLPALDDKRTQGTVEAELVVSGTRNDLSITGDVSVLAKSLASTSAQTYLTDVQARANLDGDIVKVEMHGLSSRESAGKVHGTISATGQLDLKSLLESVNDSFDAMNLPINGSVKLSQFRISEDVNESISGKSEQRFKGTATIDGTVQVAGTLGNLMIASPEPIEIVNADGTYVSSFVGGDYQEPNPNAPKLAIDFVAGTQQKPAIFKAANASFAVYGRGRIEGTTAEPSATAAMTLTSGTIRLPNARVQMDEGGTVRFLYRGGRPDQAQTRLDVDLTGRTSISARGSTGLVERYNIRLAVTGNLLEPEGQRIQASSEPSDLSQQRILALLGQSQIFESLNPTADSSQIQRQLQEALAGVALPVVFESFTAGLARDLKLDYLSFEYNGFEGLTVAFAKSLGKNLTIQGRRQLQQKPGELLRYDLSLIYRPFQRKGSFRNISFTAGLDQDRPYKIGIEYSIRF